MIRPFTLLTFGIAAAAGLQMFQIKAGVTALEREIREVNRQVEAARGRAEVLRAEWALLNEPSRLLALAQQHLALEPIRPQQFARLADLPQRAPQPVAFAGPVALFPEARATPPPTAPVERTFAALALREAPQAPPPGLALAAPPPAIAQPTAPPAAEPSTPAIAPLPPPPPGIAAAAARQDAPAALGVVRVASANGLPPRRIEAETLAPPPGARGATRPATPPLAATPPATPPRMASPPAAPAARPAPPPAAVAAAPPPGGSMLGGAGSLPPPVPRSAGR